MSDVHTGGAGAADRGKFLALMAGSLVLTALVLASNSFLDAWLSAARERAKRQAHFEKVIQKKGLDLHKGLYWKEKE